MFEYGSMPTLTMVHSSSSESPARLNDTPWLIGAAVAAGVFGVLFFATPSWPVSALLAVTIGAGSALGFRTVRRDRVLRRIAEARLAQNRLRHEAMLRASPDLLLLNDANGTYLDVQASSPDALVRPARELLGRTVADVVDPEIARLHMRAAREVLKTGQPTSYECDIEMPTGRRRVETRLVKCGDDVLSVVRDVTAQRNALDDLRRSEEQFRMTAERIGTVFYDYDVATGLIRWAGAIERLFGEPPERFASVNLAEWSARIHPEERAEAVRLLEESRDRHTDYKVIYRFRRADGSWVPVEDHGVLVPDSAGRPLRLVGTMTDISERTTTEFQLERINDCLLRLGEDYEDNIRRIVSLCAELLGAPTTLYNRITASRLHTIEAVPHEAATLPPTAAAGRVCTDLVRGARDVMTIEDLLTTPYADSDPTVRAQGFRGYAGHVIRRNQERIGTLCVLYPQPFVPRNRDVRILGILAAALSAEESRRHAEEQLAAVQDRYGFLVRGASDIAAIADATGVFRYVSPAAVRITGYTPGELLRPLVVGIHPADREAVDRHWHDLIAQPNHIVTFRYRFAAHDGRTIWLEATARNLLANPVVEGVVLNIRDVTEQQRLADDLLQSQKLETVGRLAGGVAHDFNNLLQVINGTSEMLAASEADAGRREDIEAIRAAGQRAAALTRQLLALSRRQMRQAASLDLAALVRDMADMVRRVVGERVRLEIETQPAPLTVFADRSQVEQVVLNLVVNARDAMPQGGLLRLLARVEVLSRVDAARFGMDPGEYAVLRVRDTGAGLSPEAREHLFEPFFTTKAPGEGTGLGLATVYGIVKQSGGHIVAEAETGAGAEFVVYLPLLRSTVAREEAAAPPEGGRGAGTILIAEDEDNVRVLLARVLRSGGYTVHEAGGGRQALARLREEAGRVDLLISDVVMPGLSGPDLVLRAKSEFPDLRILFISGYADGALALQGQIDPDVPFLAKPITRDALLRKVRDVLS